MRVIGNSSSRLVRGTFVAIGAMLALVAPAGIVAAVATQQVPLHNTDAPTEGGSNCPNAVDDFWHFIATPGSTNFAFESITIVAGDPATAYTFSGGDIIVNNNANNVFVKVPTGVDPYSIQLSGSYALISPATPEASFVLSHYCDGTATTTTTSTTTTSSSTTSSTTSTTTTTLPPTTTTTDAGTTTTTDGGATTTSVNPTTTSTTPLTNPTTSSSVAQLPPATTTSTTPLTDPTTTSSSVAQMPPGDPTTTLLVTPTTAGTPAITPVLPATGSNTATQLALAAVVVLGGGLAIVAASRRRGTVEG